MEAKKPQNKLTAKDKAAKLLEALYSETLPVTFEDEIREWFFSAENRDAKDEALFELFESEVHEDAETSSETLQSLAQIKTLLGLPMVDYTSENGRITVPTVDYKVAVTAEPEDEANTATHTATDASTTNASATNTADKSDGKARRPAEAVATTRNVRITLKRKIALGIAAIVLPAALIIGAVSLSGEKERPTPVYTTAALVIERPAPEPIAEPVTVAVAPPVAKPPAPEPKFSPGEEISAVQSRETVALADGSEVVLYPGGKLVISKSFAQKREVHLSGKAFFNVASDQDEFYVLTDGPTITVHGTEFMATSQNEYMAVTLYEGSLDVKADDASTVLTPGDRLEYYHTSGTLNVDKIPISEPDTHTSDFDQMPMNAIFDALENRYAVNIVRNNYANTTRYTVTLPDTDNVQIAMEILRGLSGDFDYIQIQQSIFLIPGSRTDE